MTKQSIPKISKQRGGAAQIPQDNVIIRALPEESVLPAPAHEHANDAISIFLRTKHTKELTTTLQHTSATEPALVNRVA